MQLLSCGGFVALRENPPSYNSDQESGKEKVSFCFKTMQRASACGKHSSKEREGFLQFFWFTTNITTLGTIPVIKTSVPLIYPCLNCCSLDPLDIDWHHMPRICLFSDNGKN
uniref:Uncharacterized protein n=1 Tax=Micrurus paraensis TaxID=1970185 RepID=A0A2D4KLX1_9SAUR